MNKNIYNRVHELKKPIIDIINDYRTKYGVYNFRLKLDDQALFNSHYGLINEEKATNINNVLLILDRLGYDLVPVKRKQDK